MGYMLCIYMQAFCVRVYVCPAAATCNGEIGQVGSFSFSSLSVFVLYILFTSQHLPNIYSHLDYE